MDTNQNILKKGYVYQLILDSNEDLSYINYTTNISSCRYNHKINTLNGKSGILYELIRSNNGWIATTFRILDELTFTNIQELKNLCNQYIQELKPTINIQYTDNKTINKQLTPGIDNITLLTNSDICIHQIKIKNCQSCKWNLQCRHNITMLNCNICTNEKKLCEHNKNKRNCKLCNEDKICIHNKFKYRCYYCC